MVASIQHFRCHSATGIKIHRRLTDRALSESDDRRIYTGFRNEHARSLRLFLSICKAQAACAYKTGYVSR